MKVKEFKEWFRELASGVPTHGANHNQWRRVVEAVERLEDEVAKKDLVANKEPKTK